MDITMKLFEIYKLHNEKIPKDLLDLESIILQSVQRIYDEWTNEDGNGLCPKIADLLCDIVKKHTSYKAEHAGSYHHDWCNIIIDGKPEYIIDIDYKIYEKYNSSTDVYTKKKRVKFQPDDITMRVWYQTYGI